MKAWIDPGPTPEIAPFGVSAAALPVLNVPLAEQVRGELAEAGLSVEGSPEGARLVVGPAVFVNAACVRALIAAAGPAGARLALRAPGWARAAGGSASREVDVAVVPPGGSTSRDARARLPRVEIDAEEAGFDVAQGPETLTVPAPRRVACEITSWADLLWTNLFAMTARVRGMPASQGIALVALAALRARSLNKWRIAGKLVAKGPGCDVHPSAVVEASVLGRGVKIGPGAVVRGCVVGNGVEIEELALAVGSVMGDSSRLQRLGMLKFSVACARSAVAGGVQLSVLGEGASIRMGAYTVDRRLGGGPIRVRTGGGWVEAGPSLGAAIGPGASIGTGVWIAAGRAVPGGVVVVRSPDSVLSRVPEHLAPGVYTVEAGVPTPVATANAGSRSTG